jgi:hypothetical protein
MVSTCDVGRKRQADKTLKNHLLTDRVDGVLHNATGTDALGRAVVLEQDIPVGKVIPRPGTSGSAARSVAFDGIAAGARSGSDSWHSTAQ